MAAPAPVERLGRYEILGEIASGGMATVFLGRVTGAKGFQRLVAIKRLHPHLETEEDFVAMFLDEARLAARIRHQNVVGTLDVEDQAGLYIVMEYIEGDRLLGLLRFAAKTGEKIPVPIAVRISLDTLAGLHAAHELTDDDGEPLGLVHRDVSPQNVLIGVDGVSRLTDFGIAKATSRLTVTRDGQLKGKIAYMAPEQTKRTEIDRRVDIFAMGILTWEMLTAKKLFTGESDVEVLNQLLFEPIPRVREIVPTVPEDIDAAVAKALDRDPNKRFSTCQEFAETLEHAAANFGGAANARTVATHLLKVSAEKLARDRARVATVGGAVDGGPSRVQRRPTNPGLPAVGSERTGDTGPTPISKPGTGPIAVPAPSADAADGGIRLVDDDDDIPTVANLRGIQLPPISTTAAVSAPPFPGSSGATGPFPSATTSPDFIRPDTSIPASSVAPSTTSRGMIVGAIVAVALVAGIAMVFALRRGGSASNTVASPVAAPIPSAAVVAAVPTAPPPAPLPPAAPANPPAVPALPSSAATAEPPPPVVTPPALQPGSGTTAAGSRPGARSGSRPGARPGGRPGGSRPAGGHGDDDPFGSDNPYQR